MRSPEALDTRTTIAGFLQERFPALAGVTLDDSTPLLAGGAIDSLGILDLAAFMGETFGFEIADDDFEPSNFETFGELMAFAERKRA